MTSTLAAGAVWLLWAAGFAQATAIAVPRTDHVLIDARCESDEWAGASRTAAGATELLVQQDDDTVYLCVPLPPDSYGTMDLYVLPAGTTQPVNLHASAQVGERQRTPEGWPDWTFGNYHGWYSPPVALSASSVVDGRARLTFGAVAAREVAISKAKFGSTRWQFMIEIRALGSGKTGSVRFPAAASPDDPGTWASLDHASRGAAPPPTDTETLTIESVHLGQTRAVWISSPPACRVRTMCDLLVVLDAHALFPLATNYAAVMQLMGRMPPLVIVGIPSRAPAERIAQFTPAPGEDERARYPEAGGAPAFLRFLEDEVVPQVMSRHRASTRHALIGHSLAGLFAVEAMTSGARFESYAALSPTLGWNRQATVARVTQRLVGETGPARRLFVSVAAGDTPPYLDAFARLESSLATRTPPWLRANLRRFDADDHVSTLGPGLLAAMNWLFVDPPSPPVE